LASDIESENQNFEGFPVIAFDNELIVVRLDDSSTWYDNLALRIHLREVKVRLVVAMTVLPGVLRLYGESS